MCMTPDLPTTAALTQSAEYALSYSVPFEAAKVWLPRHRLRTDYSDCDFLLSAEGKEAIKQLHVQGIISYVRSREQEEN